MNKKRKILTLVALVVFSVIIALHYVWQPSYHHSYWGNFVSKDGSGITRTVQRQAPVGSPAWMHDPIVQTFVPGWFNWNPPVIRREHDMYISLFVLAVIYVGLFAILGDESRRHPRE